MSDWKKYMAEHDEFLASLETMEGERFEFAPTLVVQKDKELPGVWHLLDAPVKASAAWCHLIVGEERALLIDTGFGVSDLKRVVETLTSKPYDVVNTHQHFDHSFGNQQFPKVYAHKFDAPYLEDQKKRSPEEVLRSFGFASVPVPAGNRDYEIVPMEDGHTFRLGPDQVIEAVHMPGHAAGGCMLLDHKTRALFSGDAVVFTPTLILSRFPASYHPEYLTVTAFRDALRRFLPRLGEVGKLYPGHSYLGLDSGYLTDMLACCEAIIADPSACEVYDYVDDPSQRQIKCVGRAMIVYSTDRV